MMNLVLVLVLVAVHTSLFTQEQKLSRVYISEHDHKPACGTLSSACIVSDNLAWQSLKLADPIEVGINKLNLI